MSHADAVGPEPCRLPKVLITAGLIEATGRLLRQARTGRRRHEGIVYWAGLGVQQESIVTTCIAPRATTTPGSFRVSFEANATVVSALCQLELVLLAQIHSHPGSFVDHSCGDDLGAFMPFEGFLSIIVPDFCRRDPWPLTTCGVHQFAAGAFRRLTNPQIERTFRVLPSICDLRET